MSDSGDDIKARILEHARALLIEAGVDGFSVREVARRSGIRVSTLQYHYKSRDELVEACVDDIYEWLAKLGETLGSGAMADLEPRSAVTWAVRQGYGFARRNRAFVRLMEAGTTEVGGLNEHRRLQLRGSPVSNIARWLGPQSSHSQIELQLRVQSIIMLIARYAILDDDNLRDAAGCDDLEEAERVVADHLVSIATDLVCSPSQ